MEVVCLILHPTLTSCVSIILTRFTYILGFDIPSFLSFLLKFFYYSCFNCFLSEWWIFVNILCRMLLQVIRSYDHNFIDTSMFTAEL